MNFTIRYFRIAVKFIGAAKIDLHELTGVLRNLGYTITTQLPPRGFKVSVGGSGPIAAKGNVIVDVNTDRLIVGVSSPEPEECIDEFVTVEEAIRSSFDTLKEINFYELLAEVEIKSNNIKPIEFMQKISKENIVAEKISDALKEPLFVLGYRLAKKDTSPEESEWIDIEIMPYLIRPHSSLYVSMVYRSRNREKILEKSKKLKTIVDAINDLMKNAEVSKR
ncbi:MAG: hypothetical protein ACTSXX_10075 [Candidatus Baldrarchaeia archaeon]